MGLGKFMADRIQQMRTQKCYLLVHPSWLDVDPSLTGPLWSDEPDMFSHTILCCPVKASARERHLQGIYSVD